MPLEDELNLVRRYVGVEQVRFGGKLVFDVAVPEPLLGASVPSFLLQPLVENAIRHGRAGADGAASIGVRAEENAGNLVLSVWDDGNGLDERASESEGLGLRNVRERLRQLYGASQSFEIGRGAEGTIARSASRWSSLARSEAVVVTLLSELAGTALASAAGRA